MYFQFLIEDKSTEILVNHVMDKMQKQYWDKVFWRYWAFAEKRNCIRTKDGKAIK